MPSRKLEDLDPAFVPIAEKIVRAWVNSGLDNLVTSTRRTREEQAELWARGRTKPGPKVTNAPPGTSKHELGFAFDFVPLVMGKAHWKVSPNDPTDPFFVAASIAKGIDPRVRWGGDWKRFKDYPHIEFSVG